MRILLACFLFISLSGGPARPCWGGFLPLDLEQSAKTDIADDGPHVLWDGGTAYVHWVRNGVHAVETHSAPFELRLKEPEFMKLRLDGRPYQAVKAEIHDEPSKIFVISDIHGAFDVMRNLLIANKVIDSKNRWIFGKGHLVILGDAADRGNKVTQAFWFIRALEESAMATGGRVHMVMGNHEAMLLTGDYRTVNPVYMNQPEGMPGLEQLYGPQSELGRWLRSRPLMIKLGGTLFVHGGISKEFLNKGLDIAAANRGLRLGLGTLAKPYPQPDQESDQINAFLQGAAGPLWHRGMVLDGRNDSVSDADLNLILARFKVKRVVVGHTTLENVASLHGGRVLAVDAGIQHGRGEGLYIEKGKLFRALADGSRVIIADETAMGFWQSPIVTEIASAGQGWMAEKYHQDYLVKKQGGCSGARSKRRLNLNTARRLSI